MENANNTTNGFERASAESIEQILDTQGSFIWCTMGNSMRPLLKTNRDIVEIKSPRSVYEDGILRVDDVALYKLPFEKYKGQYVLHRVIKVCDGYYLIRGDNNVLSERVPFDWVIGVMTGLTRRGRNVDLNGRAYRLYVKHWGSRYRRRMILKRISFAVKKPLRPPYRWLKRTVKRVIKK